MGKQWKQWQILFGGLQNHCNGDCSHVIKRRLLLERKVMTNLDSIFKSRDITLPTKVHVVKALVVCWMYGCVYGCMDGWMCVWIYVWMYVCKAIVVCMDVCVYVCMHVCIVWMDGCESWTIKKAEHWIIDAFERWCWRRLLRVLGQQGNPTSPS